MPAGGSAKSAYAARRDARGCSYAGKQGSRHRAASDAVVAHGARRRVVQHMLRSEVAFKSQAATVAATARRWSGAKRLCCTGAARAALPPPSVLRQVAPGTRSGRGAVLQRSVAAGGRERAPPGMPPRHAKSAWTWRGTRQGRARASMQRARSASEGGMCSNCARTCTAGTQKSPQGAGCE